MKSNGLSSGEILWIQQARTRANPAKTAPGPSPGEGDKVLRPYLQGSPAGVASDLLRVADGQRVRLALSLQRRIGNRHVGDLVRLARDLSPVPGSTSIGAQGHGAGRDRCARGIIAKRSSGGGGRVHMRPRSAPSGTERVLQRLAEGTVDGVTFKVEQMSPQLVASSADAAMTATGNLLIDVGGSAATISGKRFQATATVRASADDNAKLKGWRVGFIQTVFASSASGFYNSSFRTKRTISLAGPMRDGLESSVEPWFAGPEVADLASGSTITTRMDDRPGFDLPFVDPKDDSGKKTLERTEGKYDFGCWLILWNPLSSSSPVYLQYVPWSIDFATRRTFSAFESTGAGTTIGAASDGKGIGTPILAGPVPISLDPKALTKDGTW